MNKFVFVVLAFLAVLTFVYVAQGYSACANGKHMKNFDKICTDQLQGTPANTKYRQCCNNIQNANGNFILNSNQRCGVVGGRNQLMAFCSNLTNIYSCNDFSNLGSQINCQKTAVAEGTLSGTNPGRRQSASVAASPSTAASASRAASLSGAAASLSGAASSVNASIVNSTSVPAVSVLISQIVNILTANSSTNQPTPTVSPNVSVSLSNSLTQSNQSASRVEITGTAGSNSAKVSLSLSGSASAVASPTGSLTASNGTVSAGIEASATANMTAAVSTSLSGSAPVSISANGTTTNATRIIS